LQTFLLVSFCNWSENSPHSDFCATGSKCMKCIRLVLECSASDQGFVSVHPQWLSLPGWPRTLDDGPLTLRPLTLSVSGGPATPPMVASDGKKMSHKAVAMECHRENHYRGVLTIKNFHHFHGCTIFVHRSILIHRRQSQIWHPTHTTLWTRPLMLALSTVQGGEAVLLRSFLLGSNSGRLRASCAQKGKSRPRIPDHSGSISQSPVWVVCDALR
jgi:hypothetical protein